MQAPHVHRPPQPPHMSSLYHLAPLIPHAPPRQADRAPPPPPLFLPLSVKVGPARIKEGTFLNDPPILTLLGTVWFPLPPDGIWFSFSVDGLFE